ncbi:MAG: glycosyltransferase family 2 protein [Pandoraea sp.]|nr:glycosyltransferase family 2 protein [Pandoraea sp.]MDR3396779.1 glycosyltransferase family 2 protein [Pandoraea sp.]
MTVASKIDEQWAVPAYEVRLQHAKTSDTAVVIPVINEGARIRRLLERMRSCAIAEQADIVIVDGGSTDGSLDTPMLEANRVRSLLEKRSPGKLSAQLRCAYAYCLKQGYRSIVTIDGNDKDDPEAIPRFIAALDDGYDFIQASRFIRGGQEENTPLSRSLAIRMIHAPLLSIASGFHWTDTTQGFRGYSARLLLDPQVNIFRETFSEYELLAYLSYRAPKLGYRCIELATRRTYPTDGSIPTKINGMRGNWKLMRTLISACVGKYNPK